MYDFIFLSFMQADVVMADLRCGRLTVIEERVTVEDRVKDSGRTSSITEY